MAIYTVTIVRRGQDDRQVAVRVTSSALDAEHEERRMMGGRATLTRDDVRDDMARQAAVRQVWGRGVRWQSGGIVAHRGQVWAPCRTGGESAVTGEIAVRVDA